MTVLVGNDKSGDFTDDELEKIVSDRLNDWLIGTSKKGQDVFFDIKGIYVTYTGKRD